MGRLLKLTRWYNAKGASLAPDVVYNSDDLQNHLEALINGDFVEWLPEVSSEPEMEADGLGFTPLEDEPAHTPAPKRKR